jgi:hypothetical protein
MFELNGRPNGLYVPRTSTLTTLLKEEVCNTLSPSTMFPPYNYVVTLDKECHGKEYSIQYSCTSVMKMVLEDLKRIVLPCRVLMMEKIQESF